MTLRTRLVMLLAGVAVATAGTSLFAALLGIRPGIGFPRTAFSIPSSTKYTVATGTLNVVALPVDIDLGPPLGKRPITGVKTLNINVTLNTSGVVTGPFTASDVVLTGNIDVDGDLVADYSGILLSGRIVKFGFQNLAGTNDFFDFRFTPTGGALVTAGFFSGKDIGVELTSEGSSFSGVFTASFAGNAKGTLGPIALCPGKIGDFVWNDSNRDGMQDPGEQGINGVTVRLMNAANVVLASATTSVGPFGRNGYYAFEGVCGGSYHVEVDLATLPAGFLPSPTGQGGNTALDSNVNPSTVSLPNDSAQDLTIDFGFNRPCSGRIGDFVWNDTNRDGIQDAGETGIVGVTVNLRDAVTNAVLGSTVTGFNGGYAFDNLCAGSYLVEIDSTTMPPGFVASLPLQGGDTAIDSNPSPDVVTLADDFTTDLTIDFGFNLPCAGEIGDFVWFDSNRDGIQDPDELGLDGVTVRFIDDATSTIVATDITGPNGYYVFKGRCAGTYRVEVDASTVPPGYVPAPTLQGGNVSTDSNPSPFTVTLPSDFTMNSTIDFGYMAACSARIGDTVWLDGNANGIQDAGEPGIANVRLNLFDTLHVQIGTALTASDGFYLFDGLCEGMYTVEVDTSTVPAGLLPSPTLVGADRATDSNPNPDTVTLASYSAEDLTIDFGYFPANPSISLVKLTNGTDNNAPSGRFLLAGSTVTWTYTVGNPGNVPLANVVVRDDAGTPGNSADDFNATFQSGDTNANGLLDVDEVWVFTATGIAVAGQYTNIATVTAIPLTGGEVTATDPDNYYGAAAAISLVKLTNGTNNNVAPGVQVPVGSAVTWTYVVTNTGNVTLDNVTVSDDKLGPITCPAATLIAGASMTCTAAGIAVVGQHTNLGTVVGTPPLGPNVSATDPDNYVSFAASLGNFVWKDLNSNGVQDTGEPGIPAVSVTLLTCTGATVSVTTTDANGLYLFANLAPGCYKVQFATPAGLTPSPSNVVGDDAKDSDAVGGTTGDYTLVSGQNNLTVDAGFFAPPFTCPAGIFNLTGNSAVSGVAGNTRTFTVNGASVKASAFSRVDTTGAWSSAYLGAFSGGLGVTDTSETGGNDTHKTDNIGRDNYVLFEFSSPVTVTRAYLDSIGADSDVTVWIGTKVNPYVNHLTLSDALLNTLTKEENAAPNASSRWAVFNGSAVTGNVLVIAASTLGTTTDDAFKIKQLEIGCPPVTTCPTGTFDLTGNTAVSGTAGNIRTFSISGVSLKASAFSRVDSYTPWATAYLGAYSSGLGVTDKGETGASNTHKVDNIGRDNYVLFEFSKSVIVNQAFLDAIGEDSDITVWVGTKTDPFNNHLTLSDTLLNSLTKKDNDTTSTAPRWATFNASGTPGNVVVIAASTSDTTPNDAFKIRKLTVACK